MTLKTHCWHTWSWSDVCLEWPSCCCHCLHSVRSIAALLHEHDCCHKLLNLYREMKHSCNCATNVWLTLWLRKYVSIKHDAQQSYSARKHMLLWPQWKSTAFGKHWILTLYKSDVVVPWYSDGSDGKMVLQLQVLGLPVTSKNTSKLRQNNGMQVQKTWQYYSTFWYLFCTLYKSLIW